MMDFIWASDTNFCGSPPNSITRNPARLLPDAYRLKGPKEKEDYRSGWYFYRVFWTRKDGNTIKNSGGVFKIKPCTHLDH